ncbi:MAG: Translation initiation factor IF-3 [Anaerolineales bacterium]|nr:Translation initiation factor IF-3 [Anaerolineales bacterium]
MPTQEKTGKDGVGGGGRPHTPIFSAFLNYEGGSLSSYHNLIATCRAQSPDHLVIGHEIPLTDDCPLITNLGGELISKGYRTNYQIRSREVRLIAEEGGQIGIVSLREAMHAARAAGLDLVEVAGQADPPVCRLMDYKKFLYEKQKKEKEARQAQRTEVKEIRLRPKTDDYHLGFKVKQARGFLEEGAKVKVRILFRGREITHPEIGRELLRKVAEQLGDIAQVDSRPKMQGRTMLMVLSPE